MPNTSFEHQRRVTLYDLDANEQVSCATLFRYFEETAMQASAALGFPREWYRARGEFWVIRTMRLERFCPAKYLDDLSIRTWLTKVGRIRADRNYQVRLNSNGRFLARAVANWVYLDAHSMQPTRIAPDITSRFSDLDPPDLKPLVKLDFDSHLPSLFQAKMKRLAQYFETDAAGHVNNAIYVDWLEEAVRDTLAKMGLFSTTASPNALPWFCRHSIEYLRAVLPGDEVEINTRLLRRGNTTGYWEQEIRYLPSDSIVLRAQSVSVWVDRNISVIKWGAGK